MKRFKLLAVSAALGTLPVSCVTPPGHSVAQYGAGSDAAYINSTRGRADAQMSRAQEEQYYRQQNVVSREMDLEQKKRSNTINNTRGIVDLANGVSGFFR